MWPSLAPFARTLHIRGEEETLFYYDTGYGGSKPVLLLIHGLGDEADSWRHLIPRLQDEFRVLAMDLPGFGRSAAPGRISLRRHVQAALLLLDEAQVTPACPAVLAGSSMGAAVAEKAAFTRPGLVRALILLDGCMPSAAPLSLRLLFTALPVLGKRKYRAYRGDHEAAYCSLFPYYEDLPGMGGEDRRFLRERVAARVESPLQERAYFASLRSMIWTSLWGSASFARGFASFPGKTLILWGDRDRIMPPDSARILRELRPDAAFRIIPASGHLPHQENPGAVAEAVLNAIDKPGL
jgi:pimeloyl-ACP methyl ester carboxylesterase